MHHSPSRWNSAPAAGRDIHSFPHRRLRTTGQKIMATGQADVYILTAKGSNQLKGGATSLAPHELELLVLIDGRRPVSALVKEAKTSDAAEVNAILKSLLHNGFIDTGRPVEEAAVSLEYFFDPGKYAPEPS